MGLFRHFSDTLKSIPRYFQSDELALYISRINGNTKLSFLMWAICYIYWNNLLIHVMNYSNDMYKRELLLSSCLVLLLLWSIVMQNIKDKLRGSVISTVNCWSWVHWYLRNEMLWKNLGKNNKQLLRKTIKWPTKEVKTGRQQLFHRTFFLREHDILNWTIHVPGYVADLSWHRLHSLSNHR